MNTNITTAQTKLDAANAIHTPAARALYAFRYNLNISRAANAKVKAELAATEARAFRAVRIAAHALLAAKQG